MAFEDVFVFGEGKVALVKEGWLSFSKARLDEVGKEEVSWFLGKGV